MKKKALWSVICASLLVLSVSAFAQKAGNTNEDEFFGPGPGPGMQGPRSEMMEDRAERSFLGGYEMMGGYVDQEMENIAEAYKIKIERIFLEAKESRLGLNIKRRELYARLRDLSEKYRDDKSVSKEIVSTIKDLNGIQKQIKEINEKAMDKIGNLFREREKELSKANDNWIKKLETDNKELEKYLQFIESRAQRPPMMPPFSRQKDQNPPKDFK